MSRSFAVFRAVLCLSTALLMVISWPLWVTGGSFPRVPWFGWVRLLPMWASWLRFAVSILALIVAAFPLAGWARAGEGDRDASGTPGQAGLVIGWTLVAWMVLEDQFRLQPWMYQFLLLGLALAMCPARQAMRLGRVFAIALYLHSGLSKLDYLFQHDMGWWFGVHGMSIIGIKWMSLSQGTRDAIVFAMPCFEIGVATALILRARRIGVAGAAAMHVVLIVILGPLGMRHSANVLLWNAAMLIEAVALFWPTAIETRREQDVPSARRLAAVLASVLVWAAAILPLGERSSWWDTWPSFALYSSSNERTYITLTECRQSFSPPRVEWPWTYAARFRLLHDRLAIHPELAEWSLRERRVPLYPSTRAMNGVAEAFARRYGEKWETRAVHVSRADRRTGDRRIVDLHGYDEIRRFGDTFWLNAHPAH